MMDAAAPMPAALSGVTIDNLLPGRFEITAERSTSVSSSLTIEQRSPEGAWKPLENLDLGKGYRLVEKCTESPLPTCVELSASRPLHPVAFQGFDCSAQCNGSCRANRWVGPGTFRLVVRGCEHATAARAEGPAFDLPDPRSAEGLVRWGLATNAKRATMVRLDLPTAGGWTAEAMPSSGRLAGLIERPKTERALDQNSLETLVALLRDDKGYDDLIQKRCAIGKVVGVRLHRQSASFGPSDETTMESVELAFDFRCQKLFAVYGGFRGRAREVHATHFDPSRRAWLEFARHALAEDRELQTLK